MKIIYANHPREGYSPVPRNRSLLVIPQPEPAPRAKKSFAEAAP